MDEQQHSPAEATGLALGSAQDLRVESRPINSLTLRRNNPRTHSRKQVQQIAASIETFGSRTPCSSTRVAP